MFYKTAFVFVAVLCFANARPQEDIPLTSEEEKELEEFKSTVTSFFEEIFHIIDQLLTPVMNLLGSLPEGAKDVTEKTESAAELMKLFDMRYDEENETDGMFPDDAHPVLPIESVH